MAAPVAAPVAVDIEGTISSPAAPMTAISSPDEQFQTLNEPVLTTIMRDVRQISLKLRYVLIPTLPQNEALRELRNWDLWGPLVLCLVLSFLLSYNAAQGQAPSVFAAVFVLVWAGSGVVTFNAQLLGGKISFFQSVCVLGYCMCPLVIAAILCALVRNSAVRSLAVLIGSAWACRASIVFMSELVPAQRKALAVYPVMLFYLLIAWMVYIQ